MSFLSFHWRMQWHYALQSQSSAAEMRDGHPCVIEITLLVPPVLAVERDHILGTRWWGAREDQVGRCVIPPSSGCCGSQMRSCTWESFVIYTQELVIFISPIWQKRKLKKRKVKWHPKIKRPQRSVVGGENTGFRGPGGGHQLCWFLDVGRVLSPGSSFTEWG